jgi:serine/threonine protein kinase
LQIDKEVISRFDADFSLIPNVRILRAIDRNDGSDVVLKFSNIHGKNQSRYVTNFNKLVTIRHPNIIQYREILSLTNTTRFNIVESMEYASQGTLADFVKSPRRLTDLIQIFRQVFQGVHHMHKHDILHRDLKPTNILLHQINGQLVVKVSDIEFLEHENHSIRTTPEFLAPEVSDIKDYNRKSEIWAIGVMVYELFTAKFPFGSRQEGLSIEEIRANSRLGLTELQVGAVPSPFREVIEKALVSDPAKRPTSVQSLANAIGFLAIMKLALKKKIQLITTSS